MSAAHATLVRQCRDLERRCIRLGHEVGAQWAHDWGNELLDSRMSLPLRRDHICQLAAFVARREAAIASLTGHDLPGDAL